MAKEGETKKTARTLLYSSCMTLEKNTGKFNNKTFFCTLLSSNGCLWGVSHELARMKYCRTCIAESPWGWGWERRKWRDKQEGIGPLLSCPHESHVKYSILLLHIVLYVSFRAKIRIRVQETTQTCMWQKCPNNLLRILLLVALKYIMV